MKNINSDELLFVRAGERTMSALNAADSVLTFVIDAIALKSKSKIFKGFAFIWTILNVADKVRMIFANLNARKQAIECIQDEELKAEAKEASSFPGVMDDVTNNGIKYQITGKVDI